MSDSFDLQQTLPSISARASFAANRLTGTIYRGIPPSAKLQERDSKFLNIAVIAKFRTGIISFPDLLLPGEAQKEEAWERD